MTLQEQDFEGRWNRAARLLGFTPATRPVFSGRVWHSTGDIDGVPCVLHVGVPGELELALATAPAVFPAPLWTGDGAVLTEPGTPPGKIRAKETVDLLNKIGVPAEPWRVIPTPLWACGIYGNKADALCKKAWEENPRQVVVTDWTGASRGSDGQLQVAPQPLVEAPYGLALALWTRTVDNPNLAVSSLETACEIDMSGWVGLLRDLEQFNNYDRKETE